MLYSIYYVYGIGIPTYLPTYLYMFLTFLLSFLCNIKVNQLLRPFKSMHLPLLMKSYGRADLQ